MNWSWSNLGRHGSERLNPLLPRPKDDKDAEGMQKQIPSNNTNDHKTNGD